VATQVATEICCSDNHHQPAEMCVGMVGGNENGGRNLKAPWLRAQLGYSVLKISKK
jgi:hypothetical protein